MPAIWHLNCLCIWGSTFPHRGHWWITKKLKSSDYLGYVWLILSPYLKKQTHLDLNCMAVPAKHVFHFSFIHHSFSLSQIWRIKENTMKIKFDWRKTWYIMIHASFSSTTKEEFPNNYQVHNLVYVKYTWCSSV